MWIFWNLLAFLSNETKNSKKKKVAKDTVLSVPDYFIANTRKKLLNVDKHMLPPSKFPFETNFLSDFSLDFFENKEKLDNIMKNYRQLLIDKFNELKLSKHDDGITQENYYIFIQEALILGSLVIVDNPGSDETFFEAKNAYQKLGRIINLFYTKKAKRV